MVKGEATSISYQKDFEFYLKLLLHPERQRWALEVIEFFNMGVFGTKSSTAQLVDNQTIDASSHVCSWENELLTEIGNNFEPPVFPSRLPSEPPASNPRPLSVATNAQAIPAVLHEPGPAPQPHLQDAALPWIQTQALNLLCLRRWLTRQGLDPGL